MTCAVDGCTRKAHAKGWCRSHYMRDYHHGDPTYTAPPRPRVLTVGKCHTEGCMNSIHAKGLCMRCYQRARNDRKREAASVAATPWHVTCGVCGHHLGLLPADQNPWPLIERHTCERKAS